jgi:hypothetical protein
MARLLLHCHPGESRDPCLSIAVSAKWIPAFAGMTNWAVRPPPRGYSAAFAEASASSFSASARLAAGSSFFNSLPSTRSLTAWFQ